jgi:hypothetical protein
MVGALSDVEPGVHEHDELRDLSDRYAARRGGAHVRRVASRGQWIVAGALVIIGIGLMGGIVKTRQKDPAS